MFEDMSAIILTQNSQKKNGLFQKDLQPRRKFTTGAAPRQHCQRKSSTGIALAVDPHEVCRGASKASKGNTGIVLTSSAALALTFSAGVVLAEFR